MLLVVFGAGASYDSYPEIPASAPPVAQVATRGYRPPLANQLFDNRGIFVELMEQFKDCQPLVPILRQAGSSIEKKLAEFQAQAVTFPQVHRELNAIRFYLHFALWDCQDKWRSRHRGITNFATLLREIERWRFEKNERVCFVTFNYDTMLEEAMSQVLRLHARDVNSYTWSGYSLFKLHGSIDWGLELDGLQHPGNNVPYPYQKLIDLVTPGSPHLTKRYRLCDRAMSPTQDRVVLFPALSIPVENKDEFSCPYEHVKALEGLLPKVTKMITIGWRATEEDFLKMLLTSRLVEAVAGNHKPPELLVVTGSKEGAEQTVKNLAPYRVTQNPFQDLDRIRITTGFTGLIDNLEALRVFLRTGVY